MAASGGFSGILDGGGTILAGAGTSGVMSGSDGRETGAGLSFRSQPPRSTIGSGRRRSRKSRSTARELDGVPSCFAGVWPGARPGCINGLAVSPWQVGPAAGRIVGAGLWSWSYADSAWVVPRKLQG